MCQYDRLPEFVLREVRHAGDCPFCHPCDGLHPFDFKDVGLLHLLLLYVEADFILVNCLSDPLNINHLCRAVCFHYLGVNLLFNLLLRA